MPKRESLFCPGPLGRRNFLRAGLLGISGLGLSAWSQLHARAAEGVRQSTETSCIFVYLHGGPSHLETYDLKTEAPDEIRGPFKPIATNVSGMEICELLPHHARVADKFTLIRSCSHDCVCHDDGAQIMLSGRRTPFVRQPGFTIPNQFPDAGAIYKRVKPNGRDGLPSYVAVPHRQEFAGPGYFGSKFEPFQVQANPNSPTFQVPNISLPAERIDAMQNRLTLMRGFDRIRREADGRGQMEAMDSYQQEAVRLLTGDAARSAFDLSRVDPRERDRYGRSQFGQSLFLARRLVESGVGFVHVEGREFEDAAGRTLGNWDDHAVNFHIFNAMQGRLPWFDQGVSALVQDIYERGLEKRVLLIVTGEFGRTPRINSQVGTGSGVMQPGRDHWPSAMSILVSGGGMRMGQVIGSTTSKGETPKDRPLRPSDLMATVYGFLCVDQHREFLDHTGRPLPILEHGEPIRELVG